jgi:hypothetical protein
VGIDVSTLWVSLLTLWKSFLAQLPYLLIGILVFLAFLLAGRIVRGLILTAGERTRLHTNVAQLSTLVC